MPKHCPPLTLVRLGLLVVVVASLRMLVIPLTSGTLRGALMLWAAGVAAAALAVGACYTGTRER